MTGLHAWIERYFPCPYDRGGSLLVIVGVFSALLYVYTKIGFKDELRDLPQNLMVLTFLISAWGQRQKLKSDLIFKLLFLAMLIPWLLFGINALIDYETAIKYRSTNDLLKLFLFLPLAWWVGGSREGAIRMLTLAFLGLMTAIALDPNLMQSLSRLWAGQRVDFGIYNAQHGGLFFGLVILFCVCSLSQRIRDKLALNRVAAVLVFVGLVSLSGLLGTQTRAAILGLFVAAFVALLLRIRKGDLFHRYHLSTAKAVLVSVLVIGLLSWPATTLYKRLAGEKTTIHAVLTGNLDEVPFVSSGIRIHSWIEALHWIAEKPITGWGQKARSDVILLSERFPEEIKNAGFGHLHNGYLEILLGFGVVGLAFVCILLVVLLRRIKLAASDDLYAFAFYSSILFLVMNVFESFFIYSSGEFAMALFMAAGYCQYLAKRLDSGAGAEHHPGHDQIIARKQEIDSTR
ncbi:MAG: O-antigen ligase family protein [Gammaproteobacteria bacterium]|nr:O-antigen ligase family protein [Gammaproteobacteria bacterium]